MSDNVGHSLLTNNTGNYSFLGLNAGIYVITLIKDGYTFSPASISVIVPPDVENINFIGTDTSLTHNIFGKVTDEDGKGIADVTISDGVGHTFLTNENGNFGFLGLSSGVYTITATKDRFSFTPVSRKVTLPPDAINVDFISTSAYSLFKPKPDGYQFKNKGANPSWAVFRDTFGSENVEWEIDGLIVPRPLANSFYEKEYKDTIKDGNCSGMSASSMLLYKEWAIPPDFIEQQQVNSTYDLLEPKDFHSLWQESIIANFIVRYQGYQLGCQVRNSIQNAFNSSISQDLVFLKKSIDNNLDEPYQIAIWGPTEDGKCAGHALTPYAYEVSTYGTRVYVYDPNHPGSSLQYISINPSTNSWSYNLWGSLTWQNGQTCTQNLTKRPSEFALLPISVWKDKPTPSWANSCSELAASSKYGSTAYNILVGENTTVLVKDAEGRLFGNLNGDLIQEIPGSYANIPIAFVPGVATNYTEHYIINESELLTISLTSTEASQAGLEIIAENKIFSIEGTPEAGSVVDTIRISPNTHNIRLTSASTNSIKRKIGILIEGDTYAREISIEDFELKPESSSVPDVGMLTINENLDVFTFTTKSYQDSYYLHFTQAGTGASEFRGTIPSMSAGDIHIVRLNWADMTAVTLEIDEEGNNTIDKIVKVDNALNTTRKMYLPIIQKR